MTLQERISALTLVGEALQNIGNEERTYLRETAKAHNGWFTPENVDFAIAGVVDWLNRNNLESWIGKYSFPERNPSPKTVGIVMAGNIPLVGFHDFLSVLITGNKVQVKLSSQDPVILKFIVEKLIVIEPKFRLYIDFVERLHNMEAVIATGSDNTSRYFDYYFGKYPHIIRKNRSSCAIIQGNESLEDFQNLGKDIFYYFGLGCRNISKLFVPINYDFTNLIEGLKSFESVMDNHKYANNYQYNRSIFLVNQVPHWDSGFFLLQKQESLSSPTSVIYYEDYVHINELTQKIDPVSDKIQCIVSKNGNYKNSFQFGEAQQPKLWDYADHVDTVQFLLNL